MSILQNTNVLPSVSQINTDLVQQLFCRTEFSTDPTGTFMTFKQLDCEVDEYIKFKVMENKFC
jgi:hypothetical protein